MTPRVLAYVGLGSNLGDPAARVAAACAALDTLPGSRCLGCSRRYRNPPMGPADQPDYVNAVARLETALGPAALLAALLELERDHGRERHGPRWGPRLLDLDLLLYGDRVVEEPHLRVPHPGLLERPFVVFPLLELEPGLVLPDGTPLAAAARALDPGALEPLAAAAP